MNRPVGDKTPPLPRLQVSSPLGAWLANHLFKVVAALLLLLGLLLVWLLDVYGFELGPAGLTRTDSAQHATLLSVSPTQDHSKVKRQISSLSSGLSTSKNQLDNK